MKASINPAGQLEIEPETPTERYAIAMWLEANTLHSSGPRGETIPRMMLAVNRMEIKQTGNCDATPLWR